MRIASLLLALAFLASLSSPAIAAGSAGKAASKQQSRERAAKKACLTGEFQKGVGILADLYVENNDPTFIYNQGRCFEQNHRREDAIDRFLEYVRKSPDLSPADKSDVDKHIADCNGRISPQTTPQPTPQPAPAAAAPAAPTSVVQTPAPPPTTEVTNPAASILPAHDGSEMRVAGIVTGAAGILALGVGVLCNLKVNNLTNDLNTLRQNGGWDQGKERSRNSYETAGWIGYGVGAAGIVAGTTLYVLGSVRKAEPTSTVAFTPMILPGTAALSLQGTF